MAGLNNILKIFLPKDKVFYQLFENVSEVLVKMGNKLRDIIHEPDFEKRGQLIKEVEDMEHVNDELTHRIFTELGKNFITPFDRDVIHRLIARMDDILDLIQDTAESLALYDIHSLTPETQHLADLVRICCERVQAAVGLLNNMDHAPEILRICHEIDGLESDADRVMRAGVSKLFRGEEDVRQIIKLKAVYELLETATDRCQDVADVIEGVVLENA